MIEGQRALRGRHKEGILLESKFRCQGSSAQDSTEDEQRGAQPFSSFHSLKSFQSHSFTHSLFFANFQCGPL